MKHEIIYTKDYALIVSDEEIAIGDYCTSDLNIIDEGKIHNSYTIFRALHEEHLTLLKSCKKLIGHRPLNDIPTLEGIPLLPDWNVSEEELLVPFPNSTQTGRLRDGSEIKTWMLGWEEGFKEAKETYKYTEEDILDAWELGASERLPLTREKKDKLIKSLQQPKRPKYFEVSYDTREVGNHLGGVSIESIEETITNSEGQTELVGEYSYETNP